MLVFGKNVLYEQDISKIRKVYISKKDYIPYLKENNIKYDFVDNFRLDKLVNGNHQGIVIDIHDYDYYNYNDIKGNLVLMLDHLSDPHNFGSIIRTAAAAGVKEIIIPKDRSVRVNDTVIKVSSGTISKIKVVMVTNLVSTIKKLKEDGYFIYGADMDGQNYKDVDYSTKKVLVLGNEEKGISRLVKENLDELVSIKMENNVESLNVGVSAGIILFEMR